MHCVQACAIYVWRKRLRVSISFYAYAEKIDDLAHSNYCPPYALFCHLSPPTAAFPCRKTIHEAATKAAETAEELQRRAAVLRLYKTGKFSVRILADRFGMSKTAVGRIVSGESAPEFKRGRQTILPPEVEEELVQAVIRCAQAHVGLSPDQLRKSVGFFLHRAGLKEADFEMGPGWYESFMNRHKHRLSSLKGRNISKSRSHGFNRVAVADWFNFVEPLAKKFTAEETFNDDDTGFNVEVESGKVIGEVGGGQPQVRVDSTKGAHIGLTLCAAARGSPFPAFWTFKGERVEKNFAKGAPGDEFTLTEYGWATTASYFRWAQSFVKEMKRRGLTKALLYSDNADIHINPETSKLLLENNVTAVGLIPGGTHRHQPWDVCGIQNAKMKMRPMAKQLGVPYNRDTIMYVFHEVMKELVRSKAKEGKSLLQAGFLKTGLFPWNPNIFTDRDFAASDAYFGLDDPTIRAEAADVTEKRWAAIRDVPLNKSITEFDAKTRDALGEGVKLAQRKRLAKMLAKLPGARGAEGGIDAIEAVANRVWTSESFFADEAAKRASKAAELEARKAKAAATAASAVERAAEAARRSEAAAKKRAEAAAAKAAKEADKAVRVAQKKAARAAKQQLQLPQPPVQPPPPPPPPPPKRKRPAVEDGYARQYHNKRARAA